jgi:hypothetical protein
VNEAENRVLRHGHRDSRGRLHRLDGPALLWPSGEHEYYIHGVRVPPWVVTHPHWITVEKIHVQRNAEMRRVLIDRYGWARYIQDCGADVVDTCPADHPNPGMRGACLLRKKMPGDEPLVYLEMVNSTRERDGTFKRYLERIDPKAYGGAAGKLCIAAMASRWHYRGSDGQLHRTFRRWQDYLPTAES